MHVCVGGGQFKVVNCAQISKKKAKQTQNTCCIFTLTPPNLGTFPLRQHIESRHKKEALYIAWFISMVTARVGYTKHKEYAMLSLPLVRDKGGHVSVQRCGRTTHHGRWLETHQRCAPAKSAPSHWTRATARHNSRWSALGGGEGCGGWGRA